MSRARRTGATGVSHALQFLLLLGRQIVLDLDREFHVQAFDLVARVSSTSIELSQQPVVH